MNLDSGCLAPFILFGERRDILFEGKEKEMYKDKAKFSRSSANVEYIT